MSNYFALTKILLKNSLSSFATGKSKGKISNKVKNAALMTVIVVSMLPLVGAIGAMVWNAYPIFKSIGQEGLILGAALQMVSMMVLFFGIFYVMNIFYFSKDVESLLPLPLRPSTIMAAKFTVTLLYEYLTELLLLAPVVIAFGIVSKADLVYWIYAVTAFLTLPVMPLVYAGIINMILMRVTNISKNKDQFRIIGGVIAMFAAVFVNIKMQSLFSNLTDPEQIKTMMLQGNNSLLDFVSGIFPANKLLTIALVNSGYFKGLVNILLYLGITILFVALFLTLGESLYFKGLMGISESKSKRKKLSTEQFDKSIVTSSVIQSLIMKELKLLFRTPVYFINCVMMNFLFPVILLIPFLTNSEAAKQMYELKSLIGRSANEGLVLAIAFAAILFVSGTNGVTSTAISREGTNIFINKFIPVNYTEQIMGKVMAGVVLGIGAIFSMLIVFVIIFAMPLHLILIIAIVGLLAVLFTSFAGIFIDLNYPKLYWDNEQKAVKQNMNVMISILVSVVVAAVVIVTTLILKLNVWIVFGGILLVFGFANAVLYGLVKSAGENLFEKIEV